jgi:Tetratricopeptide repeat
MSANTMTVILRGLDQNEAARDLGEDTLARRRRVLGEDHPDTQRSAARLAAGDDDEAGPDDDEADWDDDDEELQPEDMPHG